MFDVLLDQVFSVHPDNIFLVSQLNIMARLVYCLPRLDVCRVSIVLQLLKTACIKGPLFLHG